MRRNFRGPLLAAAAALALAGCRGGRSYARPGLPSRGALTVSYLAPIRAGEEVVGLTGEVRNDGDRPEPCRLIVRHIGGSEKFAGWADTDPAIVPAHGSAKFSFRAASPAESDATLGVQLPGSHQIFYPSLVSPFGTKYRLASTFADAPRSPSAAARPVGGPAAAPVPGVMAAPQAFSSGPGVSPAGAAGEDAPRCEMAGWSSRREDDVSIVEGNVRCRERQWVAMCPISIRAELDGRVLAATRTTSASAGTSDSDVLGSFRAEFRKLNPDAQFVVEIDRMFYLYRQVNRNSGWVAPIVINPR